MTVRTLEEDFRRMGLSDNEIHDSLVNMHGVLGESKEVDVEEDDLDEGDFEEAYLGDLMGDVEDDDDDDDDDEDEDAVTEAYIRMKKGTSKDRRASKKYYRAHKSKIRRGLAKRKKTSAYKTRKKKLARMSRGGARTRRVVSDVEDTSEGMGNMHESLMGELGELAESIERDPISRFDEYVEAFNHIADLGELVAMRLLDEDEDDALELLSISLKAENMLKIMEGMDGVLDAEDDEILESSLADAMEEVGTLLEEFGLLEEDDDFEDEIDEDDDDDEEIGDDEDVNPFLDAADALREAKGARKVKRKKEKSRYILTSKGQKKVKGKSKWSEKHGKGASRKQVGLRKDVDSKEGLLGYLKLVKAGKVAPGQPIAVSKRTGRKLNKGARAAIKAAGK
jgi:hypothetical protein